MKKLLFIRHGESEMNLAGLTSGLTDTPLTNKGVQQAIDAGKLIAGSGQKIDKIFTSPLQRAHQTAIKIAENTHYPVQRIEILNDIKERCFGELEGKNLENDFGISRKQYVTDESCIDHIPGTEPLKLLYARAAKVLHELQKQPEETILLVSHVAFGRALYRAVHSLPYNQQVPDINNAELVQLI